MTMKVLRTCATGILVWLVVATAASAQTTDSATAIAQLYAAAAYEDALGAIAKAEPTARLEAYRAFCLLALGNDAEARAAARRAVAADPLFVPADTDASPRVLTFFREVRAALLPDLVRERYTAAKALFVSGDRPAARASFERTLSLLDSMEQQSRRSLEDLALLTREFLDLTREPLPVAPAAPPPAPVGHHRRASASQASAPRRHRSALSRLALRPPADRNPPGRRACANRRDRGGFPCRNRGADGSRLRSRCADCGSPLALSAGNREWPAPALGARGDLLREAAVSLCDKSLPIDGLLSPIFCPAMTSGCQSRPPDPNTSRKKQPFLPRRG